MTTSIPRMSRESEQRILNVLEKVADLTNNDVDPNEAIAKVASEASLPSGHIPRIVNAYNAGRTNAQRQAGTTVWEKAATFPIADADKVLELMYPDKIKSAGQIRHEEELSSDYELPPSYLLKRTQKRELVKSAAVLPLGGVTSANPPFEDEDLENRRRAGEVERQEKAASEARYRAVYALTAANTALDSLVAEFHRPTAPSYQSVKEASLRRYGEEADALFNYLDREYPDLKMLRKSSGKAIELARGDAYDLVDECIGLKQAYHPLKAAADIKSAQAVQAKEAYLKSLGKKDPPKPRHPILGYELSEEEVKSSGFFYDAVAKANPAMGIGEEIGKAKAKAIGEASVPKPPKPDVGFTDEMAKLRQKTVVQDLLSNDDVVAGHDPHLATKAYAEIADIAPLASQRPAIARDFVRRYVAGGQLNYYDLEALTRIEKNLRSLSSENELPKSV